MRRRVQPPADGETALTAKTSTERAEIPLGKAAAAAVPLSTKKKELSLKHFSFLLGMLIIFASIYFLLRFTFPKHRYHHLLEIPQLKKLLEDAPAPINEEYVVFVSNANGNKKHRYNVAFARSAESAEHALKTALTKIPLASARYPWFKVDIVTASKVMEDYNSASKHNDMPSWWFGLSMDWDKDWVFLPDEVQAHGLMDYKNRLRWDQFGKYASTRKLKAWPTTVMEDDSTVLSQLEVLHTNAVFIDFSNKQQVVPLYHGHRLFEKLTHTTLMEAAERAGDYLARNIHDDGKMVYLYRPISDSETADYGLTRHAGTVYSMAVLYQEYPDKTIKASMTRALDFLMTFVHDCALPYDETRTQKCMWDWDKGTHHVTKLGLNALTILAMAEYTQATGDLQYLETAKSIAAWMESAQKEDGSFVQKVGEPDNKLDEDYYVRYYQGEATFGLARLYNVVKALGQEPPLESWMKVADLAATCIVERDARLEDDDLLVDHWLLYGIAEMQSHNSHNKKYLQHCIRTIEMATSRQVQESSAEMDKDRLGIFGGSTSGTATATKTEGMCAVYNLFVKKNPEIAATILETTTLSARFQLQVQFRPETAMYLPDPLRVIGGFHASLNSYEMRNDYTQHNLSSFLCMARLLKEQEVAWNQ